MPSVASVDALRRAVTEFGVTDPGLVVEPEAMAAARRSLDSSGLLLLGETHGVRENPLLIRTPLATEAVVPQRSQPGPPAQA